MPKLVRYEGKHVLTQKVVTLKNGRRFRCEEGFGCMPFLSGNAIYGEFLDTGEQTRIERWQVEFVDVDEEEESADAERG